MTLNENAQATLLLTAYFSKPAKGSAKPLTPIEWGRFALWLREHHLAPANLLSPNPAEYLSAWQDSKISIERILELLRRGNAMALALEKWSRAGIWVLTRSDAAYPKRLKKRLRDNAPPVLFGCGNKDLLNHGGIAVVGSRNVPVDDLVFAKSLGGKAAVDGIAVVSGGARGVDEASMLTAVESEGTAIGILADSLLKAATSSKWRRGLRDQNLVLVSPFYPEAGFNAGNAMARNKYIYCMSDAALVAHSGTTGGTWNGALENLKNGWVPLWVRPTEDREAGNANIVAEGGHWCDVNASKLNFANLIAATVGSIEDKVPQSQSSIFEELDAPSAAPEGNCLDNSNILEKKAVDKGDSAQGETSDAPTNRTFDTLRDSSLAECNRPEALPISQQNTLESQIDFFELFLSEMSRVAGGDAMTVNQISEKLGLHKSQVNEWVSRAVEQGRLEKLSLPVRYRWR